MEKQEMENINGHGKQKRTWKMENLSREMLVFFSRGLVLQRRTKNKRHA